MINVRLNNLTRQVVGYYNLPQVPRTGEGIFLAHGNEFTNRFEVVDVTYRQPADGFDLEPEVFVVERPPIP